MLLGRLLKIHVLPSTYDLKNHNAKTIDVKSRWNMTKACIFRWQISSLWQQNTKKILKIHMIVIWSNLGCPIQESTSLCSPLFVVKWNLWWDIQEVMLHKPRYVKLTKSCNENTRYEHVPCSDYGTSVMSLPFIQIWKKKCHTKIRNLWVQVLIKKNIGCFDIPVNDWRMNFFMKVGKSSSDA